LQRRTAAASPVGTARSRPIARANLLTALAKSGDSVTRHSTHPGNPGLKEAIDETMIEASSRRSLVFELTSFMDDIAVLLWSGKRYQRTVLNAVTVE
jgi:hypothetical protein